MKKKIIEFCKMVRRRVRALFQLWIHRTTDLCLLPVDVAWFKRKDFEVSHITESWYAVGPNAAEVAEYEVGR